MEKGQIIKVEIIDISQDGQGIGKVEDLVVFVNGDMVLGDIVRGQVTKVKKKFILADLFEITEKSANRIDSFCRYGGSCGGCLFHKTSYESELAIKEKWIKDKLTRLGGIENPKINPIISDEKGRFGYRNKCVLQIDNKVNKRGEGEIKVGFFRKRSREVIDCQVCMIQSEAAQIVADEIRRFGSVISSRITRATIKTSGVCADGGGVETDGRVPQGAVMVDFFIDDFKVSKRRPEEAIGFLGDADLVVDSLYEALFERGFELESVFMNGIACAAGNTVIKEKIGELEFEISPNSFYQVNTTMANELFNTAKTFANIKEEETILDLYCGVGAIGLYIKGETNTLYGIESVKEAVIDANRNAVINGVVNGYFYTGKAEDILAGIILEDEEKFDSRIGKENAEKIKDASVIILDPPRAGLDKELINAISKHKAQRIVYVSCDPATLARDIKLLKEVGFEFEEATPVNMFSGTGHCECVCLLTRK